LHDNITVDKKVNKCLIKQVFTLPPKRFLWVLALIFCSVATHALADPVDPDALAPPIRERLMEPISVDVLELSLSDTLGLSLASSPSLDRQLAVIRQREYEVEEAYSQANPTANFQAQYQRIEPPVSFTGGQVIQPPDNYSFALTLSQPIYTFGRLRFSVLAGKLSRRSAQEEYLDRLQAVILGGAELYIQALVADEAMNIAIEDLEAQRANLRVTQQLFEQGVVARFDVLRTGAATSQAEQVLIEAQTRRENALSQLKSFMGLNLEQPILLTSLELEPPEQLELTNEQMEILERRPDLRALRWAVEAARARVDLARSENSPMLSLQNQTINRNATGLSPGTQNTTSIVLAIPLFDGGVSKNRALQAEETVKQLQADLEQRERDVVVETAETYRELQDRWRSIEVARDNVEQAEEAFRVAQLRYENGISTTVELLDSQAAQARAKFELARTTADYQRARWQWRRAAAEEFPVEVPLPPEIRARLDAERELL